MASIMGGMGRVSKAQAQINRQQVVEAAARLFRERGVSRVSVADVMAAAGLTHGGFYKRFPSKDALVAEAVRQAFADQAPLLDGLGVPGDDAARAEFVRHYLSAGHRDSPGAGCPCAGFGGDLAHGDLEAARDVYARGVETYG